MSQDADLHVFVTEHEAAEFEYDRPREKMVARSGNSQQHMDVDESQDSALHQEDSSMKRVGGKSAANEHKITLDDLYSSLTVDNESNSLSSPKYRLDTLHVRGVDHMSSEEILAVFHGLNPLRVEWVNDTSCNVVFDSDMSAARALISRSKPLVVLKKPLAQSSEANIADMEVDPDTNELNVISDFATFAIPVPQGKWRVANSVPPKAKQLIFRFAKTTDKKEPKAQRFSEFYAKQERPSGGLRVIAKEVPNKTSSPAKPRVVLRTQEDYIVSPQKTDGNRTVYVNQNTSIVGPVFSRLRPKSVIEKPYERTLASKVVVVSRPETRPSNDLRNLLRQREGPHAREVISSGDLRHRLSGGAAPARSRPSAGDLRSRLNSLRREY